MNSTILISIGVVIALIVVLLVTSFVKAPPSYAYILSGITKNPRVLIGTGGFKIPLLERLDKVFLGQVTVDVKTSVPVPTHNYIDVMVDAVCKVRALPDAEGTRLAAKNFLNMTPQEISLQIQDSLEGNMREVVGSLDLENLVTDRDAFSDQIQKKANTDMQKLGLEILSCNIQNITDQKGLIEGLGADNTYKIRKDASITKANAERDIAIAEQEAKKSANDVRVKTETEISERNNELAIKQADLKKLSDTKKAEADAAYEIQKQEQMKTINEKTIDAQIAQTKREQVLSEEQIRITENNLRAQVNAKADAAKYQMQVQSDANKYQTQINAEAALEQQKREAEAKAYLAEQEAKALKAKADAQKYAALQEAAGIEAKGKAQAAATQANLEAEAAGILAKGNAEAEAMEKKAEAYKKSEFAKLEMITEMAKAVLPTMAAEIAKPMGNIDNINIYGASGTEASGISDNVPVVMQKTMDTLSQATGVDMKDILKSQTIQAQTNRNINVEGSETVVPAVK